MVMPQKTAIVGISGSGKSTFARELAAQTGLPLHQMDALFWRKNWEPVPEADYVAAQAQILLSDQWIIEGYIDSALSDRAKAADLVIYLDLPGPLCAWRVLLRWIKHRGVARPELPVEARERLSLQFLWIILTRAERRAIEDALQGIPDAKIRRFRSDPTPPPPPISRPSH